MIFNYVLAGVLAILPIFSFLENISRPRPTQLLPGLLILLIAIGIGKNWKKAYIAAAILGVLGTLPGVINFIGYIVEGRVLPGYPLDIMVIVFGGSIASGSVFLYRRLFPRFD